MDTQLDYDATQMQEGVQTPFWRVLARRMEYMRDQALSRAMNPMEDDKNTHHWRGVYTSLVDVLALPERIIDAAKAQKTTK